jgi:uncharacterized membrane-anchored protein
MDERSREVLGKVPEITLWFWIIKIAATTLGETGGDAVTMSMNLGYVVGTAIFAVLFVIAVALQVRARSLASRWRSLRLRTAGPPRRGPFSSWLPSS